MTETERKTEIIGNTGEKCVKKSISMLVCIALILNIFPLNIIAAMKDSSDADATTVVVATEDYEQTNTIGEIGGYLSGNAITTANLFAERTFNYAGGTGFAAERGNNLIDVFKGLNASVVGDDNAANGPDRKIINRDGSITWIQDKYFPTASRSVNDAFDEATGLYRYMDGNGIPMKLEVPSDQYDDAVKLMQEKIKGGKVSGISDPEEAANLVRKGNLTFKQAKNLAKAGTVESLTYDAANGIITSGCAAGIGFLIDFTCCMINGAKVSDALKNAGLNGLRTGGIVFATYVISSQLAKAGATKAFIPTAEAIANVLGKEVCEAIVLKTGVQTAGMTSTKAAAQIIAKEMIVDGVLIVVLTGVDVAELLRGRISKEELLKNLTVTIFSIAVGTAGYYGGAALGTLIAPGLGTTIGRIVGTFLAGGLSAVGAEALIAPFYESDAEEMAAIISDEFTQLCYEYLINEEEGTRLADGLSSVLLGNTLKEMYASKDRAKFARDLIEPLFIEEVKNRPDILSPSDEELRYEMINALEGIVFIH